MFNAIHITHQAHATNDDVGTSLEGLINSRPYRDAVGRTLLIGPLREHDPANPLGPGSQLEYSAQHDVGNGPIAAALHDIETRFGVRLIYGYRPLVDIGTSRRTLCEVVAVDLQGVNIHPTNAVKRTLWEHYGLRSEQYEHDWDYDQYVQLVPAAMEVLRVMQLATPDAPAAVLAHGYCGVPLALSLQSYRGEQFRTLYYAYENDRARYLVWNLPGRDIAFYNALQAAQHEEQYFDDVFGATDAGFHDELARAAHLCDGILTIGHHLQDEMRFLGPDFDGAGVALAYQGVPGPGTADEVEVTRGRLRSYVADLLGWCPDWIFTHCGCWFDPGALQRDLDVLTQLDPMLSERGASAVHLVVSASPPARPARDIARFEAEWEWPLAHREGSNDLRDDEEIRYYRKVQAFNVRARAIRVVYINQCGFAHNVAGRCVPAGFARTDLPRAADATFGLHSYAPFGGGPLQAVVHGAVGLLSTSCGAAGLMRERGSIRRPAHLLLADYVGATVAADDPRQALELTCTGRRTIETTLAAKLAAELLRVLPTNDDERMKRLQIGQRLIERLGWDGVTERFVFPAIRRAFARRRVVTFV